MSAGTPRIPVAGGYTMIPQKFYHSNAGRNALGLVGGNEISVAAGNLVDVESDLYGRTRDLTNVPAKKYQKPTDLTGGIVYTERTTGQVVSVSTQQRHLPTIQMFSYPGVPAPSHFVQEVHGSPWRF